VQQPGPLGPLSGVLAATLEEPERPSEGIALRPNPLLCEIWRRAVCPWHAGHSVSGEARMDCSASHSWAHAVQRYSYVGTRSVYRDTVRIGASP